MPKKKSKSPHTEKTLKNLRIDNLKKELDNLKKKGDENYSPKIGRQIKQAEKKIKDAAQLTRCTCFKRGCKTPFEVL